MVEWSQAGLGPWGCKDLHMTWWLNRCNRRGAGAPLAQGPDGARGPVQSASPGSLGPPGPLAPGWASELGAKGRLRAGTQELQGPPHGRLQAKPRQQ